MNNKPLVIIESPFAGEVERNKTYARRCVLDSLKLGEIPFASHLIYTQVLDDTIPEERKIGMDAGWEVIRYSEYSVVYLDYGISRGMAEGIKIAQDIGHKVYNREIGVNP
jgi:hypothetical protein